MLLGEAATGFGNTWLIVLALCAVSFMLMQLRRRHAQTGQSQAAARRQFERLRGQSRLRESLEELLVQLEQVSREVNAQLDTKFSRLEAVVEDADRRIVRLESLLSESGGAVAGPAAGAARDSDATARRIERVRQRLARGRGQAQDSDSQQRPADAASAGVEAGPGVRQNAAPGAAAGPLASALHAEVFRMRDAGRSAMEIAEALAIPLGEVELVLSLREL